MFLKGAEFPVGTKNPAVRHPVLLQAVCELIEHRRVRERVRVSVSGVVVSGVVLKNTLKGWVLGFFRVIL